MKKRLVARILVVCLALTIAVFMIGCGRTKSEIYHIESGTYVADSIFEDSVRPIYLTIFSDDNTYILFGGTMTESAQGVCVTDNTVWTLYDEDNVAFASLVPMACDAVCMVVSPIENLVFTKLDMEGTIVP